MSVLEGVTFREQSYIANARRVIPELEITYWDLEKDFLLEHDHYGSCSVDTVPRYVLFYEEFFDGESAGKESRWVEWATTETALFEVINERCNQSLEFVLRIFDLERSTELAWKAKRTIEIQPIERNDAKAGV